MSWSYIKFAMDGTNKNSDKMKKIVPNSIFTICEINALFPLEERQIQSLGIFKGTLNTYPSPPSSSSSTDSFARKDIFHSD